MSKMRKVFSTPKTQGIEVSVFYSSENEEFVCKIYRNGAHYEPADYFTECRDDAIQTAKAMHREELKRLEFQGINDTQPGCFSPEYSQNLRAFSLPY